MVEVARAEVPEEVITRQAGRLRGLAAPSGADLRSLRVEDVAALTADPLKGN
jgi:hypothetical protein